MRDLEEDSRGILANQKTGNAEKIAILTDLFEDDAETASYFANAAEWITIPTGATVVRQFEKAEYLYVLIEGGITLGVKSENSAVSIDVGTTTRRGTPIGWSGLRPPGRYTATALTSVPSRFLRWSMAELWRLLYSDPRRAIGFLEFLLESGSALLESTRRGIRAYGRANVALGDVGLASNTGETGARVGSRYGGLVEHAAAVLRASPFFREFTDEEQEFFVTAAEFLRVRCGDRILVQDAPADGLYVLIRGRVSLKFQPWGSLNVVTRSIGREGAVFNWSGIGRMPAAAFTVTATRDTEFLYIPAAAVATEASRNPEFGFAYLQRALWLMGQFFLAARARLISEQAENEIFAITSLIDQKATELPLRSELYKVPHLLGHATTRQDAFNALHRLVTGGAPLERSLAGLQLDILSDLERETRFRDKLAFIYERIAGADPGETRAALLQEAANGMQHAFEEAPYVIDGIENLPDDAGFVAIYNHLACNKQYQLPNNFEFTLDSHFVSSILMRRFGTPGLRIVKTSDSDEFWHRGYYGRILTLKVSGDQSRTERARFYQTVENTLASGTPVVIAPEGTNSTSHNWTETSPGPFRAGAFILAARMAREPWIVPVALANFDKSAKNSVFAAVVKPPFRVSDYVSDSTDRVAMSRFMADYREIFRTYVEEARDLAEMVRCGEPLRTGLVSNLGRLDRLDREFAEDVHQLERRVQAATVPRQPVVFYGSSSFRLWETVGADLHLPNALNLGFGGSTLEACTHFFERLVVPHAPSAMFVYAGDNDIGNGASADRVVEHCQSLLYKVDQFLPGLPVHFLSIKPSPFRADRLEEIVRANRGIAELAASRSGTSFIDIFPTMLRTDGTPNPSLFDGDMLHMNAAGYERWIAVLRTTARALEAA